MAFRVFTLSKPDVILLLNRSTMNDRQSLECVHVTARPSWTSILKNEICTCIQCRYTDQYHNVSFHNTNRKTVVSIILYMYTYNLHQ